MILSSNKFRATNKTKTKKGEIFKNQTFFGICSHAIMVNAVDSVEFI